MFEAFAGRLAQSLLRQEFQPMQLRTLHDAPGNLLEATFIKLQNGIMYAVAVWRVRDAACAALTAQEAQFAAALATFGAANNCRSAMCFSVAALETPRDDLAARIDMAEDFFGQELYTIMYNADLTEPQLRFNPRQPASTLQMDRILSAALHDAPIALVDPAQQNHAPKVKKEWLVYLMLLLNAVVLTLMEMRGGSTNSEVLRLFGAVAYPFVFTDGEFFRLFTAMFLHIGLMHFVYNALSTYIFGTRVERHFGQVQFLVIYLASGLLGNVAQICYSQNSLAAGASGAVFGLMGATLAMTQITRKRLDGLSFYVMLIFMLVGLAHGFFEPNVGNAAHVGGLVTGYAIGLLFSLYERKQSLKNTEV